MELQVLLIILRFNNLSLFTEERDYYYKDKKILKVIKTSVCISLIPYC